MVLKSGSKVSCQLFSLGHCLLNICCKFTAFAAELSFYGRGRLPGHSVLTGRKEEKTYPQQDRTFRSVTEMIMSSIYGNFHLCYLP